MAETDIKILGRLVSGTSDKILAGASEIYDDTEGKKQSEINAELKKQVADMPDQWADDLARVESSLQEADNQIKGDIAGLQEQTDNLGAEINGLKGKDSAIEAELANIAKGGICFGVLASPDDAPSVPDFGKSLLGFYFVLKEGTYGYGFKNLVVNSGEVAIFINTTYSEETGWTWEKKTLTHSSIGSIVLDGVEYIDMSNNCAKISSGMWQTFFDGTLLSQFTTEGTKLLTFKNSGKAVSVLVSRQDTGTAPIISFSNCLIQRLKDGSICFGGNTTDPNVDVYDTTMYAGPEDTTANLIFFNTASGEGVPVVDIPYYEYCDASTLKNAVETVFPGDKNGAFIAKLHETSMPNTDEPYYCNGFVTGTGENKAVELRGLFYAQSSDLFSPDFNPSESSILTVRLELANDTFVFISTTDISPVVMPTIYMFFDRDVTVGDKTVPMLYPSSIWTEIESALGKDYSGPFVIRASHTETGASAVFNGCVENLFNYPDPEIRRILITGLFEFNGEYGIGPADLTNNASNLAVALDIREDTYYERMLVTPVNSIDGGNA